MEKSWLPNKLMNKKNISVRSDKRRGTLTSLQWEWGWHAAGTKGRSPWVERGDKGKVGVALEQQMEV